MLYQIHIVAITIVDVLNLFEIPKGGKKPPFVIGRTRNGLQKYMQIM